MYGSVLSEFDKSDILLCQESEECSDYTLLFKQYPVGYDEICHLLLPVLL